MTDILTHGVMGVNHVTTEDSVALHLKIDGEILPVLQIPKSSIPLFALKPYKYLWFLGYIIYGSIVIGTLTGSEDGESFSEDWMNSESLQHDNVYYISSGVYFTIFTRVSW